MATSAEERRAMKDAWEWEEEDIEALIRDGVQESLSLDYKRCAALNRRNLSRRTELSKDVSAFANSAGGVVVYGVIEDNHLPIAIDSGYDPADVTREWLEQVINSTIQRRIDDIRIKQIELKKSNPGRVIYVVYVPQSKRAPHMAENHVFYKRYNFQSIPMEEYEVRDVARRGESPDLRLKLYLPDSERDLVFGSEENISKPIAINAIISNSSISPAMYYIVRILIDKRITITSNGSLNRGGDLLLRVGTCNTFVTALYMNCSVPSKLPVWEGVSFRISASHINIAVPKSDNDADYALGWSIDSPGMGQRTGATVLRVKGSYIELIDT